MKPSRIIIALFLMVLIAIFAFMIDGQQKAKVVKSRCNEYEKHWFYIVDCYGLLAVERSGIVGAPPFELRDHEHEYQVAFLDSSKQYRNSGDYLFVKRHEQNIDFESVSQQYQVWQVTESGELEILSYDQKEDIPMYLKIDYKTGVVTAYINYDQMPEDDKKVFQELE